MSIPIASSTLIISPEKQLGKNRLILGWTSVLKRGYGPPPDPYVRSKAAQRIQRAIRVFLAKRKVRRKRALRHKVAPKQAWVEAFDPQLRRKYFYNVEKQEILWKRPMEMRTDMNRWIKSYDPVKRRITSTCLSLEQ